jgi:phosphoribosylanthranilate isomerase
VASFVDRAWGGDGTAHWAEAATTPGRVVLAGGLDPGNVTEAIDAVHPWAVDASSSLESEPGIKDPHRVEAFVAAVREAGR